MERTTIGWIWSLINTSRKVSSKGQDHGGSTCLKGTLPKFLLKWLIVFLKVVRTKINEYLATKLLELQGDQILVVTYKNTALTSQPSCPELDQHFPVRPCEAEEADQRLVRHTLNLIHSIVRHPTDTRPKHIEHGS